MKRFRLVLVAAAACLAVAVLPAAVGAGTASTLAHVTCGQVISVDTTLDADLVCSNTDGIVIGADGITLDLNGHSIGQTDPDSGRTGVAITGHEGVTVQNGVIGGFENGINVSGGRANTVRTLLLKGNRTAIQLDTTRLNVVTDNTAFGGISLVDATSNQITLNRVLRPIGFGILLAAASDDNVVKGNVVVGPSAHGIVVHGDRNKLRRNEVVRPQGDGIVLAGASSIPSADRTQIAGNIVSSAGGSGINVPSDDVVVTGNTVFAAQADGIVVQDSAARAVLTRNTAEASALNGIAVHAADATLTENHANYNGSHGIDAVAGVTDGGGNTARHNRQLPECVGVVC